MYYKTQSLLGTWLLQNLLNLVFNAFWSRNLVPEFVFLTVVDGQRRTRWCQLPRDSLFLPAEIAGRVVPDGDWGTSLYVLKLDCWNSKLEPQRMHSYLKIFLPLSLTLGFLLGLYFLFSLSFSRTKARGGKVSIMFVGQSRRDHKSI